MEIEWNPVAGMRKVDKRFEKAPRKICTGPTCKKTTYRTKAAAHKALVKGAYGVEVYECREVPGAWHTTSHRTWGPK